MESCDVTLEVNVAQVHFRVYLVRTKKKLSQIKQQSKQSVRNGVSNSSTGNNITDKEYWWPRPKTSQSTTNISHKNPDEGTIRRATGSKALKSVNTSVYSDSFPSSLVFLELWASQTWNSTPISRPSTSRASTTVESWDEPWATTSQLYTDRN